MSVVGPTHTHTHTSEHGDNRGKAAALKRVIQHVLNGERLPSLLMTIIRFVLPCNDHQIKKLLLIFWEIWPKTSPDGKLLHEMILVCDAYRKVREGGREGGKDGGMGEGGKRRKERAEGGQLEKRRGWDEMQ